MKGLRPSNCNRIASRGRRAKPTGSEAAKKLRDDLEAILTAAQVVGIGVAIPLKLYRELRATVPGAADKFGDDAAFNPSRQRRSRHRGACRIVHSLRPCPVAARRRSRGHIPKGRHILRNSRAL